ncbi:MAG: DUF4139 domain-containing protein [Smithellaceae bacterium]
MSFRIPVRTYLCIIPLFLGIFLAVPQTVFAVIREVTLFPQSARIEALRKFPLQLSAQGHLQTTIVFPGLADPESFSAALDASGSVRISDIQIRSVSRTDEKEIVSMRDSLKKLQNEKKELIAKIHGHDAQIQFWLAQTKNKTRTTAEADSAAKAIGRNMRTLYQDKFSVETTLEDLEKRIKDLENRVQAAAGKRETAWEATLSFIGGTAKELSLKYSYFLSGCGWQPIYRIEAMPASNTVSFQWDAEVWQSSGQDWKNVRLSIATLQPRRSLTPPDLPPWIIQQRQPLILKSSRKEMTRTNTDMALTLAPEAEPKETPLSSYHVWSLGEKTIYAGSRPRFPIKSDIWPATYTFLARPGLSSQVFVSAQIQLKSPMEIPPGQSSFLIDGALVGKREFSLAGSETILYFGVSPLVTTKSTTISDQSGTKRIFQNKQTRSWRRLIEAANESHATVKIRIEEPLPQSRDERILLSLKNDPEPAEKNATTLVWFFEIPSRSKRTIEMLIDVEAPSEMDIDFGWRR